MNGVIVVTESMQNYRDCCKHYYYQPYRTVYINPNNKNTWIKIRGKHDCYIKYWRLSQPISDELANELRFVNMTLPEKGYEEYFCPFKKSYIQKECFERDCPHIEYEKGRSSCSFFEKQIKKRENVKRFTRGIDMGSDTRSITMDLIDEALSRDLIPKRIVIDKNKLLWNGHHYRYVYQPHPQMVQSIPEFDAVSSVDMVKTKEIPITIRRGIRDVITVEAV